jgi:hypothetical protein
MLAIMKNWYTPPEVDFNNPNVRAVYELGRQALIAPGPTPYSLFRDRTALEFQPVLPFATVAAALGHALYDHRIYQEFGLQQG